MIKNDESKDMSRDSGMREGKTFHKLHVVGMNDDLWDKVRDVGSETWKRCK